MSKSWEQILGGYATDTLTEEEKRQLFEAALHDQTLFDTLADEEALKALLADPLTRQRILESLQASEISQESTTSLPQQLSWFCTSSSLAWAGSIAAMGLALIFGWQMNKDWGSIVQEEQEMERAISEDHDSNEVEFRSPSPTTVEMKEQNLDQPKKDQREPERSAGVSAPIPSSTPPSIMAKATKDSERIRQPSGQIRSEDLLQQEVQKELRPKAKKSVSQPPESAMVRDIPEEEPMSAPSVASPAEDEKDLQQLAPAPTFADRLDGGDATSSPSTRELFDANQSTRVDEVAEERDGRRERKLLGGLSSQAEKALTAEVSNLQKAQEAGQVYSKGQARGIRYRVVQRTTGGKDEPIDIKSFSGKWSELQLVIESNVAGHLYVLTSFSKGKWQWVRPESSNVPKASDGAIQVNPYQPVNFALSQVTNTLGKPVVSSITVLLSSTPLTELSKWLGTVVNSELSEDRLVESGDQGVFILDQIGKSEKPVRVEISLVNPLVR